MENKIRLAKLEQRVIQLENDSTYSNRLAKVNQAVGNSSAAATNSTAALAADVAIMRINKEINNIYAQERELEKEADIEAFTLLTRAGYNPHKALSALEFLNILPNVTTKKSEHPSTEARLQYSNENLALLDINELKKQGRKNVYNSSVLNIKKSSDKKTIVIAKDGSSKFKYIPETKEEKLIKTAYRSYLNNDFESAKNNFIQALVINKKNYIPALYLSYINEYEFKQNPTKESLKKTVFWTKKSVKLKPEDKFVIKQKDDITALCKYIKENKSL